LLFFLILYLGFFVYSLLGRVPDIDDAWIGEHAYWLAKDGYVHSELMRGIGLQEEQSVIHHKLFNLQGALLVKMFGFSTYTLKSLSFLYFLVFIILFYFYTVEKKRLFKPEHYLFALTLLIVSPYIFKYSFLYRPEIAMMTIGFAGYIMLEKYLEARNRKILYLFLAGFFFGITMATHLNGVIFVLAGLLLLIWNKKFSAASIYGLGAVLGFSPYFYDLTSLASLHLWYLQFFNNPSLDSLSQIPDWQKPVMNLFEEHIRYFHNPRIIVFSIFMIVSLLMGIGFLSRQHKNLFRFAILVALFTGIVAMHKSRQYLLLNFPYLVIMITLVLNHIEQNQPVTRRIFSRLKPRQIQIIFLSLFLIFVLVSTFYNIRFAIDKFSPEENHEITQKYADGKTSEMNIIAPMTFIFNEINVYHRIQGELCYTELQKSDPSIKGTGFLKKAKEFDVDLIMVSPYYQPLLGVDQYDVGDTIGQYHVIDNTPQLLVFKRLN